MVSFVGLLGAGLLVAVELEVGTHLGKGVEGQTKIAHDAGEPKGNCACEFDL